MPVVKLSTNWDWPSLVLLSQFVWALDVIEVFFLLGGVHGIYIVTETVRYLIVEIEIFSHFIL